MKLFKGMLLSLAFSLATSSLCGLQEKQLTKDIKLEYQDMESTGDDNRYQIVIRDPHLYWLETSSMVPQLLGEIIHKGTVKINVDMPANQAISSSEGSTQFIFNAPDTEGGQVDFTVDGQLTKTVKGDLNQIRASLERISTGTGSEEDVLKLLEAIKEASTEGKNLKITSKQSGNAETIIDNIALNYRHTSAALPEEFTVNAKVTSNSDIKIGNTTLSFPAIGKNVNTEAGKLSLPAWRTTAAFIHEPLSHGLPNLYANWTSDGTGNMGTTAIKLLLDSKRGVDKEKSSLQWNVESQSKYSADIIKMLTGVKINAPAGEEKNEGATFIYNWLTSPKSINFLSLLPLQSSLDFKGGVDYVTVPNLAIDNGNVQLVWFGKDNTGLKLTYQGGNVQNTGHQGTLQIQLAGGRPTYDHLINLFNAFQTSIEPVLGKYNIDMRPINKEQQNELFNLLVNYADDPKAVDKDVVLTVKDTPAGTTIGGKSLEQFSTDLEAIVRKYSGQMQPQDIRNLDDRLPKQLPQESLVH